MTNDTLLFAAAQLKKHCIETQCRDCIFGMKISDAEFINCRLDEIPQYWDIDDITGVNRDK